jgi:hypothetical protein
MNGRRVEEGAAAAVAYYRSGDDSDGHLLEEAWRVLAPAGGEALAAIAPFLANTTADERAAAAYLIGRVGEANQDPVKREAQDLLLGVLAVETDREVRDAIASGLELVWASEAGTTEALTLVGHANVNMRYAAAHFLGLTSSDDPADGAELAALEVLKSDSDPDVRGWAEFGLETLVPWSNTGRRSRPRP